MNESEIIAHARAGDEAAFTRLVEIYQTPIFNLCYRMLGDPAEAEDAAQETFLRAFAQLARYDVSRSFKTWLFSVASHHCIDRLRRRRLTWLSIEDEPLEPHPALREQSAGPEEASVQREQSAAIAALLARLSPEDRGVVVMRYWHDLSYEEIADANNTSVSAVKSRLHRARVMLAGMIKQQPTPQPARRPARTALALEG